jgi:hypothetical protein
MPRSVTGSEWDFDATTPVESNRKKPSFDQGVCPRCKHVHAGPGHDGASGMLGGIVRCWFRMQRRSARLQDKHGRYRRCRCTHGDEPEWSDHPRVRGCPCVVCCEYPRKLGPFHPARYRKRRRS